MRLLLWALLVLAAASPAIADGAIEDFRLLDQKGVSRELYGYADRTAVVLITQGDGCPIFRKSVAEIKSLRDKYAAKGVEFLLLNAEPQEGREAVAEEAAAYGVDLPILRDESQMIARSLGFTRTAEALVIDPKTRRAVYRGAIDDRLDYGTEKPAASRHYLADALDALLAGREPRTASTDVLGCLIAFEKGAPPNYIRDVAPILQAKCVRCHSQGRGPAAMTSYERVRGWAPMIRETIRTGRMPPASADLRVGAFDDNPALTPEETRTVLNWTESDLPRGDGEDPLAGGRGRPEWPAGSPDIVLSAPEQEIPAAGELPYRYVVLSTGAATDLWLKGLTVKHSARASVHHNVLYVLPAGEKWDASPRDSAQAGMALMTPEKNAFLTPGRPDRMKGAVQFVPRGSSLVLELHYMTDGRPETDDVSVGFYLDLAPDHGPVLKRQGFANDDFRVPPGKTIEVRAEKLIDRPIDLRGLMIHMHARGVSAKLSARYPDGKVEELLSLPNYDFRTGTRPYHLAEPKRMPAGTRFISEAVYDNSARNQNNPDPSREVRVGFKTTDEMFFTTLLFTEAP